jgi:hypothetical protein
MDFKRKGDVILDRKQGVFTENFVRIDTEDGVAGTIILKKRIGDKIDFSDRMNQISITCESEARELIKLVQDGIPFLNGKLQ